MQGKCQEVAFALLRVRIVSVKGGDDDHDSGRGIVKLVYPVERGYVLDVLGQ